MIANYRKVYQFSLNEQSNRKILQIAYYSWAQMEYKALKLALAYKKLIYVTSLCSPIFSDSDIKELIYSHKTC